MLNAAQGQSSTTLFFMIITLVIVLLVGLGIIMVVSASIKRAAKRYALAPNNPDDVSLKTAAATDNDNKGAQGNGTGGGPGGKFDIISGSGEYLSQLKDNFKLALSTLEKYITDGDHRYKVPWFIFVGGASGSKRESIYHSGLELPIGKVDFGENPICDWWFFDEAITLDVREDIFCGSSEDNIARITRKKWQSFCHTVASSRPKRPLDGVVIDININDLIHSKSEDIIKKAEFELGNLAMLQKETAMRFPVYLTISNLEKLPGFAEIINNIPKEKRDEIFGWSSPFAPDVSYTSSWGGEFIGHLKSKLDLIRQEVLSNSTNYEANRRIMRFYDKFDTVLSNVVLYMDNVFKNSSYHDKFFLRGVYFTAMDRGLVPNVSNEKDRNNDNDKGVKVSEGGTLKTIFIKDLLQLKIFRESSLAQPMLRILNSAHKRLNILKVIVLVASIIWLVGILYQNSRLNRNKLDLEPLLYNVKQALVGKNELAEKGKDKQLPLFMGEQTKKILQKVALVQDNRTFSFFLPPSWFSNLDKKVRKAINIAYNQIVLQSIYSDLKEKTVAIVSKPDLIGELPKAPEGMAISPKVVPGYKQAYKYVVDISKLENHIDIYNALDENNAVDNIAKLISYVYGVVLPKDFFKSASIYKTSFKKIEDKSIDIDNYKTKSKDNLHRLYDTYIKTIFTTKKTLAPVLDIKKQFKSLEQVDVIKKQDKKSLGELSKKARESITFIENGGGAWLQAKDFMPDDNFTKFTTFVAKSKFFGIKDAEDITKKTRLSFGLFKKGLTTVKTKITGGMFEFDGGTYRIKATDGFKKVLDDVDSFLSKKFIEESKVIKRIKKPSVSQVLTWEGSLLDEVKGVVDEYTTFKNDDLAGYSDDLKRIFKYVAKKSLRAGVINKIANAQVFKDNSGGVIAQIKSNSVNDYIDNLKQTINKIKDISATLDDKERKFTTDKALDVLQLQTQKLINDMGNTFGIDKNLLSSPVVKSDDMVLVLGELRALLHKEFFNYIDAPRSIKEQVAGKIIYWDADNLDDVMKTVQSYKKYESDKLSQLKSPVKGPINELSFRSFIDNANDKLSVAQVFKDYDGGILALINSGEILNYIQNLKSAIKSTDRIHQSLDEKEQKLITTKVRKILEAQVLTLANDLGNLFNTHTKVTKLKDHKELLPILDSLKDMLGKSFIDYIKVPNKIQSVSPGKIMMWDLDALKSIKENIESYNTFRADEVTEYPKSMRGLSRDVARKSLISMVIDKIAKAQVFKDKADPNDTIAFTSMLESMAPNIKSSSKDIEKIFDVLDDKVENEELLRVKDIIIEQNLDFMRGIDLMFKKSDFYGYSRQTVESWNGEGRLSRIMFDQYSYNEMKDYLESQRLGIEKIANLARVSVKFLEKFAGNRLHNKSKEFKKWQAIIKQLDLYNADKPGNAVKDLEKFLLHELDKNSSDSCPMRFNNARRSFFFNKKAEIMNLVHKKCTAITKRRFREKYEGLRVFFNRNLAGEHPFSNKDPSFNAPRANVEDIEKLYKLFDEISPNERKVVKESAASTGPARNVSDFLDRLEQVRAVLPSLGSVDGAFDVREFNKFKIDFRVLRGQEMNANTIVEEKLEIPSQSISWFDAKKEGKINPDERMAFVIRFAKDGNVRPNSDPKQAHLNASGYNARFEFGKYGFAEMIQKHKYMLESDNSVILRFEVPIYTTLYADPDIMPNSHRAITFVKVQVFGVDKDGNIATKPLAAGRGFPTSAPRFS